MVLWYNPHTEFEGRGTARWALAKKEVEPMEGERRYDLCEGDDLRKMTEEYIESCRDHSGAATKKDDRFPNLAGFCRRYYLTGEDLLRLKKEKPELYEHLIFTFEDEALNFGASPTLLAAYLKRRLGYAERPESASLAESGEMRLIFEHDINEDGI